MPTKTPPPRPKIRDVGLEKWMNSRGFSYHEWVIRVGDDPNNPITPKSRLALATRNDKGETISVDTVTRWLAQMKREMNA